MARIIAVSDTFDAITTNRPYQSARDIDDALEIIRKAAGSKFDLKVVEALEFIARIREAPHRPSPRRSLTTRQGFPRPRPLGCTRWLMPAPRA